MSQIIDIDEYVNKLRNTLRTARLNYEVWWIYAEDESRKKHYDTMISYEMFFLVSLHAHFVALVTALYCLYETRRDSLNIPKLLRHLEQNQTIPIETMDRVKVEVDKATVQWKKVSIIRNNVFAHSSASNSVSELFEKAKITPGDLKELIYRTKDILNEISYAVNRSTFDFDIKASSDTVQLLEDLKNYQDLKS